METKLGERTTQARACKRHSGKQFTILLQQKYIIIQTPCNQNALKYNINNKYINFKLLVTLFVLRKASNQTHYQKNLKMILASNWLEVTG